MGDGLHRPTVIANVHDLFERKLLRIVGVKNGGYRAANIYALTTAGRRALTVNRKEAGK
jgi:DNA-binding PadR family transcriptional regulator